MVGSVRQIKTMKLVGHTSKPISEHTIRYAESLLLSAALTWWNLQVQTLGSDTVKRLLGEELKDLIREEYCSLI